MSPRAGGPPAGPEGAGDVHVGRLALRVSGLDEDAARALARLVAERLTADLLRPAGAARSSRFETFLGYVTTR